MYNRAMVELLSGSQKEVLAGLVERVTFHNRQWFLCSAGQGGADQLAIRRGRRLRDDYFCNNVMSAHVTFVMIKTQDGFSPDQVKALMRKIGSLAAIAHRTDVFGNLPIVERFTNDSRSSSLGLKFIRNFAQVCLRLLRGVRDRRA